MLLGTGLCLSNTIAAVQALLGKEGAFLRTPKFHATEHAGMWQGSAYRLPISSMLLAEVLLAMYALSTAAVSVYLGKYWTVLFMLIYAGGLGLVAGYDVWQAWTARRALRQRATSAVARSERPADFWTSGVTSE